MVRAPTPSGRGAFRALAPELRQFAWPDKFKPGTIVKYDGSNNTEEFIQVYHTVIETVGGDDRVNANYLPTALSGMARSWLVNLPKGTIYNWGQLCVMFINNFQDTYEHPSTTKTLKTMKKNNYDSLWDYIKCFCNARNAISNIHNIDIINAFCNRVSDIKTVEEIARKKSKTVVDLLTVADVCIEALEAQAQLLDSRNMGPLKKK
jgi:hypothetical protein